ncbi:hypothetical protein GLYMA_04G046300v4 [Glycine max]|uniref:Cysteine-rich transmembrane CYSTM domain-containing protein n=1 Tax=Glycine max TaxID=3847 RepID=K7KI31_SOYBN|nr:cysteine-rich and transmembrane domain-containing protein WIH1 [Glycine max]KAG5048216.1 hypothetical protein JHK85_009319 [Glycine max]KAH1109782.1 hypothetical protein GYH30_008936 [Glycine max]KRH61426.1 hypothetical protein GLYMA_04G046300v4 [Glycine max]|eukprot:XP_006578060.1 cysteine-rich and transmembrane domain-containing protein WIH1 [Glycine max]
MAYYNQNPPPMSGVIPPPQGYPQPGFQGPPPPQPQVFVTQAPAQPAQGAAATTGVMAGCLGALGCLCCLEMCCCLEACDEILEFILMLLSHSYVVELMLLQILHINFKTVIIK